MNKNSCIILKSGHSKLYFGQKVHFTKSTTMKARNFIQATGALELLFAWISNDQRFLKQKLETICNRVVRSVQTNAAKSDQKLCPSLWYKSTFSTFAPKTGTKFLATFDCICLRRAGDSVANGLEFLRVQMSRSARFYCKISCRLANVCIIIATLHVR